MIRALVETPAGHDHARAGWRHRTQPIGIEDVVAYLREALELPLEGSAVYEIGGPDRVSYGELMREYARQRGLRRAFISVPVLTPRLSSLWLGLVTPVYARVGRALVDGLRNETIVRDDRARTAFPVRPAGRARGDGPRPGQRRPRLRRHPLVGRPLRRRPRDRAGAGLRFGSRSGGCPPGRGALPAAAGVSPHPADRRRHRLVPRQPAVAAPRVCWISWLADRGSGAGRRDPDQLLPGDTLDFWRVEAVEPNRLLRLAAEMRLPGRAWLQFEVEARGDTSIIHQTAIFDPVGLFGQLYWYALWPLHQYVFGGTLRALARAAQA